MNNEWLARLKEKIGKKENKEELPVRKKLLLLFLTGLLLLVIVLPFPKKSDSEEAETGTETTTENRGSYERYLEQKTEEALQCVEGVGNVKVMITLKSSEENVVEKDQQSDGQSVEEEDSQGGKRTTKETSSDKTSIYEQKSLCEQKTLPGSRRSDRDRRWGWQRGRGAEYNRCDSGIIWGGST